MLVFENSDNSTTHTVLVIQRDLQGTVQATTNLTLDWPTMVLSPSYNVHACNLWKSSNDNTILSVWSCKKGPWVVHATLSSDKGVGAWTLLHFTMKKCPCLHPHNHQQENAHPHACPVYVAWSVSEIVPFYSC